MTTQPKADKASKPAPKAPQTAKAEPAVKNPANVKQAVAIGQEMTTKAADDPEITKAAIARAMYPLIQDEAREVIAQAFVDGAGLTPKGAMTYYYNTKRKAGKATKSGGA